MRDDVSRLFSELLMYLKKKSELFYRINEHCARIRYSSDHSIEGEISLRLKENKQLIDEIRSLDEPIAAIKKEICSACGIGERDFNNYFRTVKCEEFINVESFEMEIDIQKKRAGEYYEAICEAIDIAVKKTSGEIDSLSRLRKMMDLADNR